MTEKVFTYILKGKADFFYCGITKDINKRIFQHNTGKSISTKKHAPYSIKYLTRCASRQSAHRLEVRIKRQGVKRWYQKNIQFGTTENMVCTELISGKKS